MDPNSKNVGFVRSIIQHYNPKRYWTYRSKVINPADKSPKWLKTLMLFYIKRCDAYNNASMGTNLNCGAKFKSPPRLPHGLNGIIIHYNAQIGHNCTIHQQVTIGEKDDLAANIGDNVFIGAGAKIIGGVTIGDNVKIGANCIIVEDIPSNSTVVMPKPRIIIK